MKIMKCALTCIMVIGIVLQGFVANAFASNGADEIAKLNAGSGSRELLNQKAGEVLPSAIQPLNNVEMKTLIAAEAGSSGLLHQTAAGWQKDDVCQGSCGGGCGPCPGSGVGNGGVNSPEGTAAVLGLTTALCLSFVSGYAALAGGIGVAAFAEVVGRAIHR